jgi:hypothetical protein
MREALDSFFLGIITLILGAYYAVVPQTPFGIPTEPVELKNYATSTLFSSQLTIEKLPSIYEKPAQEYGGSIPSILVQTPYRNAATIALSKTPVAPIEPDATTHTKTVSSVNEALVNIFCTLRSKNRVRATTGSGVFLGDRGVILTNAHVAQFLLLNDSEKGIDTSCTIRGGAPAKPLYYADLLYISPLWVDHNVAELHSKEPSGTGERDYALIYVTKTIDGTPPPIAFPGLIPHIDTFKLRNKNSPVVAAGFPAESLRAEGIQTSLMPTIATTTITQLFTYAKDTVDVIGIAPSKVGEQGSSGGPVVDFNNTLIGLITTKGDITKDGEKSLRAITLPYIDRTIREETRVGLLETIASDLPARARIFKNTLTPILSSMVIEALK